MTYDDSNFRLYINGVQDSSQSVTSSVCQNTEPLKLGSETSVFTQFNGNLDDVRVYNQALTASEILDIYNLAI